MECGQKMQTSEVEVSDLVSRARTAQEEYEKNGSQKRYDDAAKATALAILKPENNKKLAYLAVQLFLFEQIDSYQFI